MIRASVTRDSASLSLSPTLVPLWMEQVGGVFCRVLSAVGVLAEPRSGAQRVVRVCVVLAGVARVGVAIGDAALGGGGAAAMGNIILIITVVLLWLLWLLAAGQTLGAARAAVVAAVGDEDEEVSQAESADAGADRDCDAGADRDCDAVELHVVAGEENAAEAVPEQRRQPLPLPPPTRQRLRRDLARTGNRMALFCCCATALLTIYRAVAPAPYERERHVLVRILLACIAYGSATLLGCSAMFCSTLARADLVVNGVPALARTRRLLAASLGAAVVVLFVSQTGLALFLGFFDVQNAPGFIVNALICLAFVQIVSLEFFWTMEIMAEVIVAARVPPAGLIEDNGDAPRPKSLATLVIDVEKRPWFIRSVPVQPASIRPHRVALRATAIAVVLVITVLLWTVPWIALAGPSAALEDYSRFWEAHRKAFPSAPAIIFSAVVCALMYVVGLPFLIGAFVPTRSWPRLLVPSIIPFYVGIAIAQSRLGRPGILVDTFLGELSIVTIAGSAIVLFQMAFLVAWLRRVRPAWTFVIPAVGVALVAAVIALLVRDVAVPLFLAGSTRTKIIVRLVVELVAAMFSFLVLPLVRRLGEKEGVLRRYVVYAIASPFSLLGRFMVAGVDDLLSQLVTVLILALFELASVIFVPVLTVFVALARNGMTSDDALVDAIGHARRKATNPVMASVVLLRAASEYSGVLLAICLPLLHAAVWLEDIDYPRLVTRLLLSVLMQLAVEFATDMCSIFVRQRRFDLVFTVKSGGRSLGLIVALVTSVLISIMSTALPLLCRTIALSDATI